MTNQHQLDKEIENERREKMTQRAKQMLVIAGDEINRRNGWIKAREEQKQKIEAIRREVYKAYDAADMEALEMLNRSLREVVQESTSTTNRKRAGVPDGPYDPFNSPEE